MKKFILIIPILIILAVVFLPIYKGQVRCGIVPPCFNEKINLIEYIKYKNRSVTELLKECPDEMIINKMPSVGSPRDPSSYYIDDGSRREIYEYDVSWVNANCEVHTQEAY